MCSHGACLLKSRLFPWTCSACNVTVATRFCADCGEAPLRARDLTLHGLWGQIVQGCTSIDGVFLRSIRFLIVRPGALTLAYLQGQRKPYTLPLQLFLLANVLFFAMQSLTNTKIFSTPLEQHLQNDIWGGVAQQMVTHRVAARHTTIEAYAPVFNHAVATNAKTLVVLMVLPFALLAATVFLRSRRPFLVHVVFSLHFYAFLLLVLCMTLAITGVTVLFGGRGLQSIEFDHAASVVQLAVCFVYLYIAAGLVYGVSGVWRFLKVAVLVTAIAGIFLSYRFLMLVVTLYTT